MTPKIRRFLAEEAPATPCLVVDLDVVAENFRRLRACLPRARICYAVKANPARPILDVLVGLGAHFDAASLYEIDQCLAAGATPERITYGNTIKKQDDIEAAFAKGIRLFAFDSEAELEKLAEAAPESGVYCRILTSGQGAQWPLSRKFGCELPMAHDLMRRAHALGLKTAGLSFHVGSQQTDPAAWEAAVGHAAQVCKALADDGVALEMINMGGGFPIRYREPVPEPEEITRTIEAALARHFEGQAPGIMIEPGRVIAGSAGVLLSEVVLISNKRYENGRRWVYLDIGKFGGLAETMDEAIEYPIVTPRDGGLEGPVVIAGPTCDGADILYEKAEYALPIDLEVGDRVCLMCTGAYTTTYSSVGFNGFPPLAEYYI